MLFIHGVGNLEFDSVLRALRAGDTGFDRSEVELEQVGVQRVGLAIFTPQALLASVGLDKLDLRRVTAGQLQVTDGLSIDREDCTT